MHLLMYKCNFKISFLLHIFNVCFSFLVLLDDGEDVTTDAVRRQRNVETNQDCRKTIEQETPD